jgi:regulatory protein
VLEPTDRVLSREVEAQRALDLAYRYLGRRDRTVLEMRRHLEGKRVEPDLIDEAIAELLVQGYLDDARYAQRFAEDRRTLDAWGADRIEQRLLSVGVDRADIAAAVEAQSAIDELDAAVDLLRRKVRVPPVDDRARERALAMLVRRGYALELAYDAVRAFERDGP